MTIKHKNLAGGEVHEPKDISVANSGDVYIADGVGSGAWAVPNGGGDMLVAIYDPGGVAEQLAGLTASQTLTTKTMTAGSNTFTGFVWDTNIFADGTDGQIPTFDANGEPAFVATGSAKDVLTSNGAGTAPTMQTPIFSEPFTSSDQTITTAGQLTLPHNLSSIPVLVVIELICQTDDIGYTAGDIVQMGYDISGTNNKGISVIKDATNIVIRYGSSAAVFSITAADTGDRSAITNANWKLRVTAYA